MRASLSLLLIVAAAHCGATPHSRVNGPMDAGPFGPMFRGRLVADPERLITTLGLDESEKATVVAKHNEYRGDVSPSAANMVPMQWDDELAASAQSWADQCAFSHDSAADRRTNGWWWVGQNIAYGYGYGMVDYMDLWNDEKVDYDYGTNSCASGKVCGHYTQVVWAESAFIGCGWATCPYDYAGRTWPFDYLVCNYGPGGNFNGESPYVSGGACSGCPSGYNGGCDANLCQA